MSMTLRLPVPLSPSSYSSSQSSLSPKSPLSLSSSANVSPSNRSNDHAFETKPGSASVCDLHSLAQWIQKRMVSENNCTITDFLDFTRQVKGWRISCSQLLNAIEFTDFAVVKSTIVPRYPIVTKEQLVQYFSKHLPDLSAMFRDDGTVRSICEEMGGEIGAFLPKRTDFFQSGILHPMLIKSLMTSVQTQKPNKKRPRQSIEDENTENKHSKQISSFLLQAPDNTQLVYLANVAVQVPKAAIIGAQEIRNYVVTLLPQDIVGQTLQQFWTTFVSLPEWTTSQRKELYSIPADRIVLCTSHALETTRYQLNMSTLTFQMKNPLPVLVPVLPLNLWQNL